MFCILLLFQAYLKEKKVTLCRKQYVIVGQMNFLGEKNPHFISKPVCSCCSNHVKEELLFAAGSIQDD